MESAERRSSDYEQIRRLTHGYYGPQFLVREGSSGKEATLDVFRNAEDSYARLFIGRMATVPVIVNLPWLIPTLGFFCDSNEFGLVTEYCPNGTLADALRGIRKGQPPAGFGPTQLMKCVFGVAFAMAAFHSRRGILRTLSPESVFLDSQFEPKIGQLVLAKIVTDPMKMSTILGLPKYKAPEIANRRDPMVYDQSVDVFSFAVLLLEVFGPSVMRLRSGRTRCSADELYIRFDQGERYMRPRGIPDSFWALVTECWKQFPADRPTFADIVDLLKHSPDLIVPGTDVAAYREYQRRLEGARLEDPRPLDLIDGLFGLFEWDPDARPDGYVFLDAVRESYVNFSEVF